MKELFYYIIVGLSVSGIASPSVYVIVWCVVCGVCSHGSRRIHRWGQDKLWVGIVRLLAHINDSREAVLDAVALSSDFWRRSLTCPVIHFWLRVWYIRSSYYFWWAFFQARSLRIVIEFRFFELFKIFSPFNYSWFS